MDVIPTTDNERRERAEQWQREDRREEKKRFLELPPEIIVPQGYELIPNTISRGLILVRSNQKN